MELWSRATRSSLSQGRRESMGNQQRYGFLQAKSCLSCCHLVRHKWSLDMCYRSTWYHFGARPTCALSRVILAVIGWQHSHHRMLSLYLVWFGLTLQHRTCDLLLWFRTRASEGIYCKDEPINALRNKQYTFSCHHNHNNQTTTTTTTTAATSSYFANNQPRFFSVIQRKWCALTTTTATTTTPFFQST